ncbi:DUF3140 domain-containing protein [Nocardioides seonyuensis]|uniref:DUF3140 domain-containing protein n=1 Tax=Nocardioides seonyuensis TaxID=2518371 RepID=A0A4P7ID61_9ACTN|nr:DUF3140 domain-containing protein [Nocardioides seonyuensis]QBX55084.1 DUF3140 domain-containing protein [Nocardioides seonyuensis]
MAQSIVSDDLWQEFHTVVNMTSRELSEWLRTEAAGEDTEPGADLPELELGQHVHDILGKRRTDLTDDDVATMQEVVDQVRTLRGEELEPAALDDDVRHLLMSLGHDPLKPPEA